MVLRLPPMQQEPPCPPGAAIRKVSRVYADAADSSRIFAVNDGFDKVE
jgi:hypothetical protein